MAMKHKLAGNNKEKEHKCEEYIEGILQQMTLDEKIGMIHGAGLFRNAGVPRLGVPAINMSDGPMGVRQEFQNEHWAGVYEHEDRVTYLPSNSAIAATWNPKRAKECGEVLGSETRARGKDVILAPGINIKRTPLCGRNFEYMSEDPYLVSEMTVPLIEGIQKQDVAACVKHFAVNGQETNRLWVDTIVDERTLNEIYLPAFEAAVHRGHSYSIMGAYNMLNGQHCCENKVLLGDILRKQWNYDGAVISDWGGVHDTRAAAESELDLEMSVTDNFDEYCMANPLKEAIQKGGISIELVDKKVRNLLRLMYRLKMLDGMGERKKGSYHSLKHIKAARKTARESVVLLKNEDNILPLKLDSTVAVIGQNATAIHSCGGGSAEIKALYEVTPLMALLNEGGGDTHIEYEPGYFIPAADSSQSQNWQETSLEDRKQESAGQEKAEGEENTAFTNERDVLDKKIMEYRERAVRLARENRQTIIFAGLNHDYDVEGGDKESLKLPYHQDELIDAVLDANPNAIVVIMGGAPVEMDWLPKAKAVVWYYYAGLEGATAVARVITGKVNPSGKLPETFPKHTEDNYSVKLGEFGKNDRLEYRDGVFVGYRYYVSHNIETNFCFGHGLSYTSFSLEKPVANCGEDEINISVMLRNTGERKGKETVQLYITPPVGIVERPVMELKGFKKKSLEPEEEKKLEFVLDKRAFSYYDVQLHDYRIEPGEYVISLGMSVQDIRQSITIRYSHEKGFELT